MIMMDEQAAEQQSRASITDSVEFIVRAGVGANLDKQIAKSFPDTYGAHVSLAKDAARRIVDKKRVKSFQDLEDKWSEGGTEIHDGIKVLLHCLSHNDHEGTTEAVTKDILNLFAREEYPPAAVLRIHTIC
jgi:hypothetical protein